MTVIENQLGDRKMLGAGVSRHACIHHGYFMPPPILMLLKIKERFRLRLKTAAQINLRAKYVLFICTYYALLFNVSGHGPHDKGGSSYDPHSVHFSSLRRNGGGDVQLTPSWEERNVSEDQLNFRTLSASMDRLDLEINPPRDR